MISSGGRKKELFRKSVEKGAISNERWKRSYFESALKKELFRMSVQEGAISEVIFVSQNLSWQYSSKEKNMFNINMVF